MTAYSKELIIFDLDGTLAPSKFPMEPEMAALFAKLLERKKVAVISGGSYPQFQSQFLTSLPGSSENYANLFLLPTSGTQLYAWRGNWTEQYAERLTPKEKEKVMSALDMALRLTGYARPDKVYGQVIEDRGSQITFSANGQDAPLEVKAAWDPTREKREKIAAAVRERIPEYDVRLGGTNSIDITRRGVNKGYGIRKLEEYLKIIPDNILFVGDALYIGGNDYPAKAAGVDCIQVSGPAETRELVRSWLE